MIGPDYGTMIFSAGVSYAPVSIRAGARYGLIMEGDRMRAKVGFLLSLGWLIISGCGVSPVPIDDGSPPVEDTPTNPPDDSTPTPSSSFITASGKNLVVGEGSSTKTIQLRGINLQNHWLVSPDDPSSPFFNDDEDLGVPLVTLEPERYDEAVIANIVAINANVIRNAINFRQFEDNANPYVYKQSGFDLLDQQIELAKEASLYTIIDLHVPPGGLQGFVGPSARLWEQTELRDRTKALWRAIAERYRDEMWVAAYDLINEPMPSQSPSQWASFAQELVDVIREVDTNHLLIVEQIVAVVDADGNYPDIDPDDPWIPKVTDNNVMYDFHFYEPIEYVGQGRPETGQGDNGGVYPDESIEYPDHDGTILGVRNKAYLKLILDEKLAFQRQYNVPINVGEFSSSRTTFLNGNAKGGLDYTTDILALMNDAGLSHQYFAYLNVFFFDWEYDETPELRQVSDSLSDVLTQGLQPAE
jgi:Cellulase (glycosyl hydrolase family 5)